MPYFRWLHVPLPVRDKARSKSKERVVGLASQEPSPKNGVDSATQDDDEQVIQKSEIYLEIDSNSTVVES